MEGSENLKAAGSEIEAIMKKHDVSGFLTLWEPNFREVKVIIDPTFSCVKLSKDNKVRVIYPLFDPSNPEPAKQTISDTINMLTHLGRTAVELANNFTAAVVQVRKAFNLMPKLPTNGQIEKNGN